jgi:hypothetical protein
MVFGKEELLSITFLDDGRIEGLIEGGSLVKGVAKFSGMRNADGKEVGEKDHRELVAGWKKE